jgi:hypothetical protein
MSAEDWFDQGDDYVPLRPKWQNNRNAEMRHMLDNVAAINVYTHDRDGNRVYPGDYVKCEVTGYMNLKRGERRRVISVSMDTLVMRNKHSPTGTSAYQPRNFTLSERHHAWHKSKEAKMAKNTLFVAVRIDGEPYDGVASIIRQTLGPSRDDGALLSAPTMVSETSFEALKAWLYQRIRANPDERWLILSGTTLAEISAPPVSFRPA